MTVDAAYFTQPYLRHSITGAAATLTTAALATIATIVVAGRTLLCVHFDPTVRAITDLQVYVKAHPDAQYADITPTSSTWATPTTPSRRILHSSVYTTSTGAYVDGDLNTVATTENGYLEIDVTGLHTVLIKGSCATDNTGVVTPRWQLT